tara:strand:- start:11446 stop:11589 length:144 start_codon:yes stop_codon:yes gene_type:complete
MMFYPLFLLAAWTFASLGFLLAAWTFASLTAANDIKKSDLIYIEIDD